MRNPFGTFWAKAAAAAGAVTPARYWTSHNVARHHAFTSAAESLEYFHWRNDQYVGYIEMLPVAGHDGKVVLDYGCGPGHDLVGFAVFSRPRRLIGLDVSATSLAQARARLAFHDAAVELVHHDDASPRLPFADASIDYVHSSGVLHHVADPAGVLRELRRVVRPDGEMRVMVYNYESLFLHLYTAYIVQIRAGRYPGESVRQAFSHLTDGPDCPIADVYRPREFVALAESCGWRAEHLGNATSVFEIGLVPERCAAIPDRRLPAEHRRFLLELTFDAAGLPLWNGRHAGVDGCFRLRPA
jgi:ubiquinone/menaquinone biosynthesis C-methylase UbiE